MEVRVDQRPKVLVHGTGWREESKRRLDVKGGSCWVEWRGIDKVEKEGRREEGTER